MIKAYLTIDDVSSVQTPHIIDFLNEKGITPVMFCVGEWTLHHPDEAVYALKHGAILQNHSFTHPFFSKLSFRDAKKEILKNEKLLDRLYRKAGVTRPFKLFRFPYGDNGGTQHAAIQAFLKKKGFNHIDDTAFDDAAYFREGQKANLDVLWTFDFAEYQLPQRGAFTFDDVKARTEAFVKEHKDEADLGKARHIVLIHDHPQTDAVHPGYFAEQICMLLDAGVQFVPPAVQ